MGLCWCTWQCIYRNTNVCRSRACRCHEPKTYCNADTKKHIKGRQTDSQRDNKDKHAEKNGQTGRQTYRHTGKPEKTGREKEQKPKTHTDTHRPAIYTARRQRNRQGRKYKRAGGQPERHTHR